METKNIPQMMNSVVIESHGKVGFARVPVQKPDAGQVLIKVEAAGLNPSDILFMRGLYNIKLTYPYTPGWEGSGIVVDGGDEESKKMIG